MHPQLQPLGQPHDEPCLWTAIRILLWLLRFAGSARTAEWSAPLDTRGKRYPDVPGEIAAAASEAHACMPVETYRGAVILARSVIEATAEDKGMTTGNLIAKIDTMHEAHPGGHQGRRARGATPRQ